MGLASNLFDCLTAKINKIKKETNKKKQTKNPKTSRDRKNTHTQTHKQFSMANGNELIQKTA